MNPLVWLALLGGLFAIGGGSSSGGSTGSAGGRTTDNEDVPETTPDAAPEPVAQDDPAPAAPLVVEDSGSDTTVPDQPDSAFELDWAGLTAEEQLIVELVNRARLDPASELGRQDEGFAAGVTTAPKEALAVVQTLSDASDAHSQDMDNRDFFAHTNPSGESPSDRAIDAGHETRFVGENIGWVGSTRTSFDEQARAEGHHDNLWDSDGHQQNFMSNNWNEIGIGYDYGDYLGYQGSTFVTEMFSNTGETYLTGVVIEDGDDDDFYDIGEGQGGVQITAFDGENTYTTSTWEAGGYTLALPPGTYRVLFEGGDLDAPYETDVTIGDENVKLDVIDEGGALLATVSAGGSGAEAEETAKFVMETSGGSTLPNIVVADDAMSAGWMAEDDEDELLLL